MRRYLIGALAAGLLAGGLIVSAPQASAGCENAQLILFPTAQKCDGPVHPDGSWERCVVYYAPPGDPAAQSDCHWMGANRQVLAVPFFSPPTHIDP